MPLPAKRPGEAPRVGPITAGIEAGWRVLELKACYREALALYSCRSYEDAATSAYALTAMLSLPCSHCLLVWLSSHTSPLAVLRQVAAAGSLGEQVQALLQKSVSHTPPPGHIRERRLVIDKARERVAEAKGRNRPLTVFASKEEYEARKNGIREAWKNGEKVLD